jgi:hypothetical protein
MLLIMACLDVRAKLNARDDNASPGIPAVYDRRRVTVLLALYDGSGWSRA